MINEATKWLDSAKDRKNSSVGLGIRWQRALAAERMAAAKDAEQEDHERWLKIAVGDARDVSRFPGEFHSAALTMMGRLGVEQVRKKGGELHDFAAGLNVARKNMDEIESLKERLDAASGDERTKLQNQWREHLQETAGRLRRVLDAADSRTDRKELNQARYFLAFVDYELGRNDEAAILADYAARRLRSLNAELARESARLALAAYEQEYDARPPAQRSVMVRIAQPVAEFLDPQLARPRSGERSASDHGAALRPRQTARAGRRVVCQRHRRQRAVCRGSNRRRPRILDRLADRPRNRRFAKMLPQKSELRPLRPIRKSASGRKRRRSFCSTESRRPATRPTPMATRPIG